MTNDTFLVDSLYLQKVVRGYVDVTDVTVAERLTTLQTKYTNQDMPGMIDLIGRAFEARERFEHQADLDFLEGLLAGVVACFRDDVSARLKHLYDKYPQGSLTYPLLDEATGHYGAVIRQKAILVLGKTTLPPKTVFLVDLFNAGKGVDDEDTKSAIRSNSNKRQSD